MALTFAGAAGLGTALADPPSLSVRNASGTPVAQIHISPDYATTWGNNRLAGVIPPGAEQNIAVDDRPDHCFYDVQITDAAGKQRAYWNQNLCTRPSFEYRGE